jgi:hypothetical protein
MSIKRRCAQCKKFKETTTRSFVVCGDLCGCEDDEYLCHKCAVRAEKTGDPK